MKALEVLINSINAQIEELNKSNFKIYDEDNVDWHISKIRYSEEEDRLYFATREETDNGK